MNDKAGQHWPTGPSLGISGPTKKITFSGYFSFQFYYSVVPVIDTHTDTIGWEESLYNHKVTLQVKSHFLYKLLFKNVVPHLVGTLLWEHFRKHASQRGWWCHHFHTFFIIRSYCGNMPHPCRRSSATSYKTFRSEWAMLHTTLYKHAHRVPSNKNDQNWWMLLKCLLERYSSVGICVGDTLRRLCFFTLKTTADTAF